MLRVMLKRGSEVQIRWLLNQAHKSVTIVELHLIGLPDIPHCTRKTGEPVAAGYQEAISFSAS